MKYIIFHQNVNSLQFLDNTKDCEKMLFFILVGK
jgi:hypothetical protein